MRRRPVLPINCVLLAAISLLLVLAACADSSATAPTGTVTVISPTAPQPVVAIRLTPFLLPTVTPAPPPTPMPAITIQPPGMRTGIEEVDTIIGVVLGRDIDALRKLVRYTTTRCTTASGLGGPPKCGPDETEGTRVEAFPILGSEGAFVRRKSIAQALQFRVVGLYAVYRVPENAYQEEYWPAGKYGIVFVQKDGSPLTVLSDHGGIVRIVYHMDGSSPATVIKRDAGELILPPIAPTPER